MRTPPLVAKVTTCASRIARQAMRVPGDVRQCSISRRPDAARPSASPRCRRAPRMRRRPVGGAAAATLVRPTPRRHVAGPAPAFRLLRWTRSSRDLGSARGRRRAAVVRARPAAARRRRWTRCAGRASRCRIAAASPSPASATWSAIRCGWPTCRPICRRPRSRWRTGGSGTIPASISSAWPRRLGRHDGRPHRAGRLDDHPAGRQEPVPDQRPHVPPQGAGSAADAVAGAHIHQARDPRDLAEPRLSRFGRLGRGRRGAHVFRRIGAHA